MAFTPIASLVGGALIGMSASAMLAFNGRIAGISGILGGALRPTAGEAGWRISFLGGLLVGALALALVYPSTLVGATGIPLVIVAVAGVLVGVGTQLGSGCTSGHGVCGISRFSPRSLAATLTFMVTGALSSFVVQHVILRTP